MNLPSGWKRGWLGEACSIEIGGTPSRNMLSYWDDAKETTNLWVSIRDLNRREITQTAEQITDLGVKHSNVKLQPKGTVLLSFKLTIGRVAVAGLPLYTNEAIAGLRSQNITRDYLYHGLQEWDLLQGVDQAIKGATLNKEKLKRIEIDFPECKSEQAEIAEILSTIDRAIEQTETLIAKQHRIKAGLILELLTRGIDEHGKLRSEQTHKFKDSPLGRIPVEWEVESLDRCVKNESPICYGILMPGANRDNGVPVIKVRDIIGGRILQNDILLTDPKIDKLYARSRLRHGDVLITIRGTTGRIAIVPGELDGANITQDTARIRLKDEHSNQYFYFLLQSNAVQDQISLHTVGQAVKGINIRDVKEIRFAIPRKKEQLVIAVGLQEIQRTVDTTDRELKKLCNLKIALMQDLLTGRKRVTDLLATKQKREKVYAGQ